MTSVNDLFGCLNKKTEKKETTDYEKLLLLNQLEEELIQLRSKVFKLRKELENYK